MKQAGGIKVFIRYDVHAVRAGIKLKGQAPLNNLRVYRQTVVRLYKHTI